jgi:hypothetical protein
MRHAIIAIALAAITAACGKSAEQEAKEEAQRNQPKQTEVAPASTVHKDTPAPAAKPTAPEPDPNNAAEVDRARNQAMIDGRDKDVLRYCVMAKLDDKSNPQALLGCTLAACRSKDLDNAKLYSHALPKLLMEQAKRVCAATKIDI